MSDKHSCLGCINFLIYLDPKNNRNTISCRLGFYVEKCANKKTKPSKLLQTVIIEEYFTGYDNKGNKYNRWEYRHKIVFDQVDLVPYGPPGSRFYNAYHFYKDNERIHAYGEGGCELFSCKEYFRYKWGVLNE